MDHTKTTTVMYCLRVQHPSDLENMNCTVQLSMLVQAGLAITDNWLFFLLIDEF